MTPLFLLISIGLIWANLIGLGLLGNSLIRDYAVSRIASLLVLCLSFFFLEHFFGMGPSLSFLPFSTALSAWLIWKDRGTIGRNWGFEAAFGVGLLYCLVWRYTFPDIGLFEENFPDLIFIHDYFVGAKLPPPDRWMPPFKADFYYSFQFYCAALLGRWFNLGPSLCYHLAYCVMSGMITCSVFTGVRRLSAWRPAGWAVTVALLLGGCGLGFVIHLAMKSYLQPLEMVRYLGMVWDSQYRTALGKVLDRMMYTPGVKPIELPVEPLSYIIAKGEFHPPLMGFVILTFSFLLIFTLDGERLPRQRWVLSALLASTVPLALIGNTWVFPLQTTLVLGWFIYRGISGERSHWMAGFFGAGGASALAYPFLVNFLQQSAAHTTTFQLVRPGDHATPVEWLSVFWPVVCLMVLAFWSREKRGLSLFFVCLWAALLAGTELFYNHDINGATWERFNSTLKWWGWIYAGGVLSLGALNLGSRSAFCRYGSLVVMLLPCIQIYDYGRQFAETPKDGFGKLDGTAWLTRDFAVRDMVSALKARPDGICIDSGNTFANTDATVLAIYANKQAFMGWPVQEGIWREFRTEVRDRVAQVDAFYSGKMADPLGWLTENNVRYVLWLQKDNDNQNARFLPLWQKIKSRYAWRHFAGNDGDWAVGFWERVDPPAGASR
jgi:uncharacterized membrane protein